MVFHVEAGRPYRHCIFNSSRYPPSSSPTRRISQRCIMLLALMGATSPAIFGQQDLTGKALAELSGSIRRLTKQIGQIPNVISVERSSASGVIVDTTGFIITDAHVVEGATSEVQVTC